MGMCVRQNGGRVDGSCRSVDCHSLFSSAPVIIFSLIIFPWQLIAFYYMHPTNNPGESLHTRTHVHSCACARTHTLTQHIKERCLLTSDSCVRLRITPPCWVSARGNREKAFDFSCSVGRKGGWRGTAVKFINSNDLPVKASSFFSTRPNINKHNHVQMSPNEMWQFYWA